MATDSTLSTMMILLAADYMLIAPCSRSTLLTAPSASSHRPITKIRRTADTNGDPDAANNMYQVVVKAEVVDSPRLDADSDPVGPHAIYRKVTVIVRNLNEVPEFPETTDTLEISENADDLQKEPPATAEPLYLLNRGVGKPSTTPQRAPYLDIGVPVVASDDDSTANFPVGGYFSNPRQQQGQDRRLDLRVERG